jgi:16S rRNA (adenine1518-N6/adenine1519-N6)-dimethyltransferase
MSSGVWPPANREFEVTKSYNQTISYLTQRFREIGVRPDTRHGQNFLIDLNLLRILVDAADLGPDDVVLEVGSGTGGLTAQIARRAGHVITIEIDRHLFELASEELIGLANVEMIQMDVLKNKNRIQPEVMQTIERAMTARPGGRLKLVANLPYNIATPLISNLLLSDAPPHSMTVTIQREVAERLVAAPGTKDYGALSVWAQCQCDVQILRILPTTVFWPRPKVQSAFVHISLDRARRAAIPDPAFFHDFVRAIFMHRRKYLRSVLLAAFKGWLDKPGVDELLGGLGLDGAARAEQLGVATMLSLAEATRVRAPTWRLSAKA